MCWFTLKRRQGSEPDCLYHVSLSCHYRYTHPLCVLCWGRGRGGERESQSWIFNLVCVRGVEDEVNRGVAVMELSVTSCSVQLDLLILKWALRDRNLPHVILCFATLKYTRFYGVSNNIKMETLFSILYQEQLKRMLILSLQRFCSPPFCSQVWLTDRGTVPYRRALSTAQIRHCLQSLRC